MSDVAAKKLIVMSILLNAVLFVFSIPVAMFVLECTLGLIPRRGNGIPKGDNNKTCAILIPAYNEAAIIAKTLESIRSQISDNDQVIVVADNCTDNTTGIVKEYQFTALERENKLERGKGYAIDFGLQHLKAQVHKPEIVIIIDADCLLGVDALFYLKQQVVASGLPAQSRYLMKSGDIARIGIKISEFAFMIKNHVRLLGLSKLNMPVPLTGTGMAFPWEVISNVNLATGDIVEDMRLGVELAERDMGAQYCAESLVFSYFPTNQEAEKTQRERWEHGHLGTMKQFVPRLLKQGVAGPSLKALGMALDLAIPPLSLLVILVGLLCLISTSVGVLSGEWYFFFIALFYLVSIVLVIVFTWLRFGREILSLKQLLHIPKYVLGKTLIYARYIVRKQTKWIRTDRQ